MDAPDELVEAARNAAYKATLGVPMSQIDPAVRAVLSVPALAEVIARDAKVREIVEQARATYSYETDAWGRTHLDAYDAIAALYPEAGK